MRFDLTSAGRLTAARASKRRRSLALIGLIAGLLLPLTAPPVFAENLPEPQAFLTQALDLISSHRMVEDIRTLSGPTYSGRQTGTPDDLASAEFVRQRFLEMLRQRSSAQASPGDATARDPNHTRLQSTGVRRTIIDPGATLQMAFAPDAQPDRIGTDYLPVLDSPSADLQAPLVFVGYGISDQAGGWDEYAGVDVRGKIVLFLRGKPERYPRHISHTDKVHTAHAHGALGYLTATGPILTTYEARRGVTGRPSAFYGLADARRTIPGAWISTARAMALLGTDGSTDDDRLRRLQQSLNEGTTRSTITDSTVTMRWHSAEQDGLLHNVLSILPGNGTAQAEEAIVIGAHRDHFGKQGGLLFAGADDNASGTAVLLEVGRVLSTMPAPPTRTIVFVSFSGEEQGLLGSKFYVSEPVVPLRSTTAMVNIDHAAVGNGRLTIGLTGIEKPVAQQAGQQAGLADRLDLFGFFPGGDHVPFKEAGVPTVTVVSGGTHTHFHQPTDTVDTVNPDILTAVARFVLSLVWRLAEAP